MIAPRYESATDSVASAIEYDRLVMDIDLGAITHNFTAITRAIDDRTDVIAVLKGDAYGMGADVVAQHLQSIGVTRFATDNATEAVRLREAGIDGSITVLYGEPPTRAYIYIEHDLMPTIYDVQQASACAAACETHGAELAVWLGVNLGFNRAGAREDSQFVDVLAAIRNAARLRVVGVLAHLTSSHARSAVNDAEISAFGRRVELVRNYFGAELQTSLFASHGLLRWAKIHPTDWIRPGLLLAGEHCFESDVANSDAVAKKLTQFRPAIGIRARVIHLVDLRPSESVGYAPHFPISGRRRLATVALGFRSGLPTEGRATPAICDGRLVERIGPMGMDSLQLDVTHADDVDVGDWVTLVGQTDELSVSLTDVCSAAKVTPYQLLARLHLPRRYKPCDSTHSEVIP